MTSQSPTVTATDLYALEQPSACELRVHLRAGGVAAAEPGPYVEVLRELGERHELAHLATLGDFRDLGDLEPDTAEQATVDAIDERVAVIYQPRLRATAELAGRSCELVGVPDLLLLDGDSYRIRDVKVARRINDEAHPEILLQLQLYGWLYAQSTGQRPIALEVYNGAGEIIPIDDDGGDAALERARRVLELREAAEPPDEPVGWTKCGGCGYRDHCWPEAEERRDVALVFGVDQGLARALHRDGILTIEDLLERFDQTSLANYERPWGQRRQRVGTRAASILTSARALHDGEVIELAAPHIPPSPNYVMFDLEGLPPHLDETDKVYLWGMQVFGETPGEFVGALAGFGPDGDREGWEAFLAAAQAVFADHGDLPFVHWHHYEQTKIDAYVDRHGDPDGVAARVSRNLLDLLPVTQAAVVLPLSSYSLKQVERFIGFERSLPDARGDWSMAAYVRAVETEDSLARAAIIEDILTYNREDLEATWAVFSWLRDRRPR